MMCSEHMCDYYERKKLDVYLLSVKCNVIIISWPMPTTSPKIIESAFKSYDHEWKWAQKNQKLLAQPHSEKIALGLGIWIWSLPFLLLNQMSPKLK